MKQAQQRSTQGSDAFAQSKRVTLLHIRRAKSGKGEGRALNDDERPKQECGGNGVGSLGTLPKLKLRGKIAAKTPEGRDL